MLKKIFELLKKKREEKEFVEVESAEEKREGKILVRVEKLGGVIDVDRIARLLREGNIIFLKVRELQKRDFAAFNNSVQKLKKYCREYGWDLVGVEGGFLVVTPKFARIARG